MKKTILTCDRCEKEVENLIEVGAGKRDYNYNSSSGNTFLVYQLYAEWCVACCVEMGITQPYPKNNAVPIIPAPTLEDIIREIIREEVQNAGN